MRWAAWPWRPRHRALQRQRGLPGRDLPDDLRARIRRLIDYVQTFTPAQIDGSDGKEIVLQLRAGEVRFTGEDYLKHAVLPNVYFHLTTTYALLRHAGVELGKRDFLG